MSTAYVIARPFAWSGVSAGPEATTPTPSAVYFGARADPTTYANVTTTTTVSTTTQPRRRRDLSIRSAPGGRRAGSASVVPASGAPGRRRQRAPHGAP